MYDSTQRESYWSGEEIKITFTGQAERGDYGVPRSPVTTEIRDIEVTSVEIFGITVDPSILPVSLQTKLKRLGYEANWLE